MKRDIKALRGKWGGKGIVGTAMEMLGLYNHGRFTAQMGSDQQWYVVDDDGSQHMGPYRNHREAMTAAQTLNNLRSLERPKRR